MFSTLGFPCKFNCFPNDLPHIYHDIPQCTEHLHCTNDLPHCTHDTPPVYCTDIMQGDDISLILYQIWRLYHYWCNCTKRLHIFAGLVDDLWLVLNYEILISILCFETLITTGPMIMGPDMLRHQLDSVSCSVFEYGIL